MICPNCGREIPDGATCPCTYETLTLSSNPAVNVIKSVGSSKLFLAMTILRTLSLVLAFVSVLILFATGGRAFPVFQGKFSGFAQFDPSILESTVRVWNALIIVYLVIIAVVFALTLVPYWLHYVACRSRKTGNVSTVGLTFWKVFTWIAMVYLGLICGLFLLYILLFLMLGGTAVVMALTSSMDVPKDVLAIFVGLLAFMVVFLGLTLGLTFASMITRLRVIDRAKAIANTGVPNGRVSRFLIVMTWILGVYSIAGSLAGLVLVPLFGIAALGYGVSTVLSALCLSRYKKEMTAVMYPPVMPTYAQPAEPVTEQPAETTESDSEQSE